MNLLHLIQPNRTLALMLCVFWFVFDMEAQNLWNKTYIEDRPTMRFHSVVASDTTYNIIGVTVDKLSPFYEQALTVKLDTSGTLINYRSTPDTGFLRTGPFWNTLITTHTGGFAFAGYGQDTMQHLVFGLIDKSFDSIQLFRYYTPNTFAFQGAGLIQYDSDTYFIAGVHTLSSSNNANVVLVKIDSHGNRIWEKYYDQLASDYTQSIIMLDNGNLLLGAVRSDLNTINQHANTWLLEVDTGGDVVRQWFDPNDSTYGACGLRQTKYGGFIYGAQKKVTQAGGLVAYTNTIIKMDSNLNKQWTFAHGARSIYTEVTDIEVLSDGNYIVAGNEPYLEIDSNTLGGWICKLDTSGSIIWERKYRGINAPETFNYINDLDVLANGDLIAVGMAQDNNQQPSQRGWLLKLDSNGCELENCLVGIDQLIPTPIGQPFRVYPNPTIDEVNCDYNWIEWEKYKTVKCRVVNVAAQKVAELELPRYSTKQVINVKQLAQGIYTVEIVADKKQLAVAKMVKQ
jgi:hypothetical protein